MAVLNVWMNGEHVGQWSTLRTGTSVFRYSESWTQSAYSRPLSVSLPITADRELRGSVVENYFDNLLPDSVELRRRMRSHYGARSLSPFDLLAAAGRDCVGAVQLLEPKQEPLGWNRIEANRLSEADVAELLRGVGAPVLGVHRADTQDFRISIAGAQEKTALLHYSGAWHIPKNSTPTTHILKLPLGLIGGARVDMTHSVENEWLCAQFLRELGLPVANTSMAKFEEQSVLVVERFDRRWMGIQPAASEKRSFKPSARTWIARLPQEDFCQALGLPPSKKYEADGGPSMESALQLLSGGEEPEQDKSTFVLAQLAFWLLAATDGHGKNFSLRHYNEGRYRMTPLYDVISMWPVVGDGANQISRKRLKMSMALAGKRRHYRLEEIQPRHFVELATRTGVENLVSRMRELADSLDAAWDRIEASLPKNFPIRVFSRIRKESRVQAKRFLATPHLDTRNRLRP
ncbi:MAG TPA: type II toxin-antitoxin system HipA family toxin [Steroidobacteraceae bacterium]|nr:type II toxin-antitoxin system HipA family toxin [Steroidobacteraceae bacterium]